MSKVNIGLITSTKKVDKFSSLSNYLTLQR